MWPGFGENMRVLGWIIRRCKGDAEVNNTPIGGVPLLSDINIKSLDTDLATLEALLEVDCKDWVEEMEQIREYLEAFGDRLPHQLIDELNNVVADLKG